MITSCPRTRIPASRNKANSRANSMAIREMLDKMIAANTVEFTGSCTLCQKPTDRPMLVVCNGYPGFFCPGCYAEL